MGKKDPRVDAYISKAAPFARPILEHLRGLVHRACPEVTETVKWSMPFFDYQGPLCNMAAFKGHCAFGFWKTSLMKDSKKMLASRQDSMGSLGKILSLQDLPGDKTLLAYIQEAMALNEAGIRALRKKPAPRRELEIPAYLISALKKNREAWENFEQFPYSHRKEYVQWLQEAKTDATREKRLQQALEWIAEGKDRNWKYRK
jgi:uncharacterized protein YdeI (YjbR/CyaY-like superfamily)